MLKRALIVAGVVLAVSFPAYAEEAKGQAAPPPPEPPTLDLSKTPSGMYELDKSHAFILFKIKHLGFSNYRGRINNFESQLNFDAQNPEKSSLEVVIDMTSADSNNPKMLEHYTKDFFNTAQFPTATFKSTKITKTAADKGTIDGTLTFLGVSKPVTLNVTFNGSGIMPFTKKETLGFSATAHIKRSDFGLTAFLPMIGDDVDLEIETEYNYAAKKTTGASEAQK